VKLGSACPETMLALLAVTVSEALFTVRICCTGVAAP